MLTFSYHFDCISISHSLFFQSVSVNVKPVKRFSDGVLILHPEAMLSVIAHIIGQFYDTVLCLEHIADIR